MSLISYGITCSTKILNLAIGPLLFISVGVLCQFAMVPDVYMLLATHSPKWFKPLSDIVLLCQRNTSKEYDCKIIALSLVLLV